MVPAESLPAELAALLHRAHDLEVTAVGSARTAAFRRTRALLGGARVCGYPVQQLADCLAVTPSSIRARSYVDEWVSETAFAALAGVSPAELSRWRHTRRLSGDHRVLRGESQSLASDLITALVTRPVR
jgi:hypothetical protein